MIRENIRETIRTLYESGKSKRKIARFLNIDIKTVRKIIDSGNDYPKTRRDKIIVPEEMLKELYQRCDGYIQRMYEILTEEDGVKIGYSTLTRLVREYFPRKGNERCKSFPDIPGEEMQHDTSVYYQKIGGRNIKIICSGLYFRYSKMRYIKFYHRFNRFLMKCFFHEALTYFGYSAKICIIDNTHLAVLHGTGERAVFHPEMIAFAKKYGFTWKAHRIKQSNRKAGKERNFLTLETNFFPGRNFKSLEDLNTQAKDWALERFANRPLSKSALIPGELFEFEKTYLVKLTEYIEEPYQYHERIIDRYGYIAFNGNYYWIPEGIKGKVKIVEHEKRITIYQKYRKLVEYNLPPWDVKNNQFVPENMKNVTRQPNNRKKKHNEEEKKLRQMGDTVVSYLDFILSPECIIKQKSRLIRELYRLSKKMTKELFVKCIKRAMKYKITKIESLAKIAGNLLNNNIQHQLDFSSSNDYENRPSYQQGRISREGDLKQYQRLIEDDNHE
jgi:hypothetical protein